MADDRYRRTDGAGAAAARGTARTDPATDPLVELARLIGQNDPVAYEPTRAARPRDGVESRIERGPAPIPRRSEPAPIPRAPDPRASEPRYSDSDYPAESSGYPESRQAQGYGEEPADPRYADPRYGDPRYADPRYADPPQAEPEQRHVDQRYDGYTEPPRAGASARPVDPPAWLTSGRAPDVPPEPRAAESGWRAPRPRDPAPAPRQAAAPTPAYDDYDPHGGRPLDNQYTAAEPMFPAGTEPLALGRNDHADYDPRYAPGPDGAFETGESYDPERGHDPYGQLAGMGGDPRGQVDQGYEAPRSRRNGLAIAAAIMALAVVGTAGAYGFRVIKGGDVREASPPVIRADTSPKKIASAVQGGDKQIYERVGGQNERVVPREEQPVAIRDAAGAGYPESTSNLPPVVSAPATVPAAGGATSGPKAVRTVTIRPDGDAAPAPARPAPPAAQPVRPAAATPARPAPATPAGPMAITPQPAAPAAPAPRTAMTTPTPSAAAAGNYVVQLSAQKSPEEARASFRAMQDKYPSVLSNRQVLVKKKDLGAKGIYYGTQVGPFAAREEAVQLCESLKAAGGNCLVQKN